MPVVKDTVHGPLKTVYYEESPLMSTYLIAIVVGLFDYIESSTLEGERSVFMTTVCFIQSAVLLSFFPYFYISVGLLI
jgi:puromycin-sensitive aminopeptidase